MSWVPPRVLLVSASAGSVTPDNDLAALQIATDAVESCIESHGLLPSGPIRAIEVTLRYAAKSRPARRRQDKRRPELLSVTKAEPINDMVEESFEQLVARFIRAIAACLRVGADEGYLDADALKMTLRCVDASLPGAALPARPNSPQPPGLMDRDRFWHIVDLARADTEASRGLEAAARELGRFNAAEMALFDGFLEAELERSSQCGEAETLPLLRKMHRGLAVEATDSAAQKGPDGSGALSDFVQLALMIRGREAP